MTKKLFLQKFLFDEQGAAAPIIALALTSMVAAAGSAVDYARAQMVQAKLADTLDAAGLAAGASYTSQDATGIAQTFFDVNFPSGYMQATPSSLAITENSTKTKLTLSASATVPTLFLGMMGLNTMTVSAASEITRKAGGLELVMVLDNTGSMSGSKIADLQTAATTLVDSLFGDDETNDKLWIGLVPFAQSVNIGTSHPTWIYTTYKNSLDWGTTSWMGCVDGSSSRTTDTSDTAPDGTLKAYYWPDDGNNDWISVSRRGVKTYRTGLGVTLGPNKYCSQQVTPMTNTKSTILTGINSMQARGNTHIGLGAVWGWRMISPNWRGHWGGDMDANNLPLDYGTKNMAKAVVIMSDGENTMSNSSHSSYHYLSNGMLGSTSSSGAVAELDTRLSTVCTNMKAHGIKVYTVLFDTNSTNVENLFRNCASQADYYFKSPSPEELHQAFKQIADSLSNLRISK